jgi:hypothetical protein
LEYDDSRGTFFGGLDEPFPLVANRPILEVKPGFSFTLVLTDDGAVRWFGNSGGTGSVAVDYPVGAVVRGPEELAASPPLELGGPVDGIEVGPVGICVWQAGRLRCWRTYLSDGWEPWPVNDVLDQPGETPDMIAEDITMDGRVPIDVALGGSEDCMLFEEGDVWCVGPGIGAGPAGAPPDPQSTSPNGDYFLSRLDTNERVVEISGGTQMCAVFESGRVRCWGEYGGYGGLGYGDLGDNTIIGDDKDVMDLDFPVVDCP